MARSVCLKEIIFQAGQTDSLAEIGLPVSPETQRFNPKFADKQPKQVSNKASNQALNRKSNQASNKTMEDDGSAQKIPTINPVI